MSSEHVEPQQSPTSLARPSRTGRATLVQLVKFGLVGVSNTALTFAVFTLLLKGFGVWYLAASAIGFAVGATNGFLLNRRWTFSEHVGDSLTPVRWALVQGTGLGVNVALLYVLVDHVGLDELVGQAIATAVVTVSTFFVNRAWTFRAHAPVASPEAEVSPALDGGAAHAELLDI
ncbi:MAG TPA: GtrA family protein [Solirubrobacteraceae bacterium]|nr:GtrA family protein [Solirubrobacteraceae bacterium]